MRSVGDEVRYNDQVKLESVKTEGQFVHCSSRPYKGTFSVLENWYDNLTPAASMKAAAKIVICFFSSFELNLSATESALTLISHYRPFPSHDPKALRVMSFISISA